MIRRKALWEATAPGIADISPGCFRAFNSADALLDRVTTLSDQAIARFPFGADAQ